MILLCLVSTGCARTERWKEEVRLEGGSTLIVQRKVSYLYFKAIGEPGGWSPIEEQLHFKDPHSGKSIRWKSKDGLAYYLGELDGDWIVVKRRRRCRSNMESGWEPWMLHNSEWAEATARMRGRQLTANLLLGSSQKELTSSLERLSLEEKERLNLESTQTGNKEFQVISLADNCAGT
jgi:hypothetical protein